MNIFTVQNAHSRVFFYSDINKDQPHFMNNAMPYISCFLVNARSIINNMDELEIYTYALKPDLIIITGLLSREGISDAEVNIDDYYIL